MKVQSLEPETIIETWPIPVTKKNGKLRSFGLWKIPSRIVNRHRLMDDETFLVDVKVGNDADKTSIAAERFKLVSGHEINLKGHAKVVEKLAQADPSSTVYFSISIPKSAKIIQSEFEAEVEQSLALTPDERRKRLDSATKIPPQRQVVAIVFRRNADVVAFVLDRAKGHCELCGTSAPFVKAKDQQPYLEVHHKVTLADGGEDTVQNAIALCPNCHRKQHYGLPEQVAFRTTA